MPLKHTAMLRWRVLHEIKRHHVSSLLLLLAAATALYFMKNESSEEDAILRSLAAHRWDIVKISTLPLSHAGRFYECVTEDESFELYYSEHKKVYAAEKPESTEAFWQCLQIERPSFIEEIQ